MHSYENLTDGLTAKTHDHFKQHVLSILRSPSALVDQKRDMLIDAAYKTLPYPPISNAACKMLETGKICLLGEGPAPYHPRYVAPDFERLLTQGSNFFELEPARNLFDVVDHLLTAYQYAPSSGLPVFLGYLDRLFEPYLDSMPEEHAYSLLRSFWRLVDRLHPNGFVHGNIGPQGTRAGQMLLEIDREIRTITNLSLLYDPHITPRNFALQAVNNTLELSKPYFVNHPMMVENWGEDYVMASCFNPMKLAGGVFTLVRVNLKELIANLDCSLDTILDEIIPETAQLQMEIINSRIRFLVEDIQWFNNSIFVREGLLLPEKFTTYAAVFGLNEGVNGWLENQGRTQARYGHDDEANQAAQKIIQRLHDELMKIPAAYCTATQESISFHAQVGISSDIGITPGVRIPAGEEPPLYEHFNVMIPMHKLFSGGISTIIEFDQTARSNPEAVLDIIDGAHRVGLRNLSIGSCDSEYIRVSGYLVRRSDLEAAGAERTQRMESNFFGLEFIENQPNTLHRRIRKV